MSLSPRDASVYIDDHRTRFYRNDHPPILTNVLVDWRESADAHIFKVDIPGVGKDDMIVEVKLGAYLRISGRINNEEKEEETWHCAERVSGSYSRKFKLSENAKTEETKASMKNSVLTVTIPKIDSG